MKAGLTESGHHCAESSPCSLGKGKEKVDMIRVRDPLGHSNHVSLCILWGLELLRSVLGSGCLTSSSGGVVTLVFLLPQLLDDLEELFHIWEVGLLALDLKLEAREGWYPAPFLRCSCFLKPQGGS